MLIDLSNIDHETVLRRQERNRIRIKLSKKTVKQLREFAREHHITLGGESSKRGILDEIMGQYGHQWHLREDEIE